MDRVKVASELVKMARELAAVDLTRDEQKWANAIIQAMNRYKFFEAQWTLKGIEKFGSRDKSRIVIEGEFERGRRYPSMSQESVFVTVDRYSDKVYVKLSPQVSTIGETVSVNGYRDDSKDMSAKRVVSMLIDGLKDAEKRIKRLYDYWESEED